jgi:hypothetical protein
MIEPVLGRIGITAFGLSLLACGPGADSWPAGRPKIDELQYLQQSSTDPWSLQFLLIFTDTDGDLGSGVVELSIDGDVKLTESVGTYFAAQTPAIGLDATAGELELKVKLSSDTIGALEIGDEIEVGFVLQDAAGQRSNDPSITVVATENGGGG